jgi:hypothetical protein
MIWTSILNVKSEGGGRMMKRSLLNTTVGISVIVMLAMVAFVPAFAEKPAPPKVIKLSLAHTIPPVVP